MTRENKTLLGLEDLKTLRLKCNGCEGEHILDINAVLPSFCPAEGCNQRWAATTPPKVVRSICLIGDLRDVLADPASEPFTIRLEIPSERLD